MTGDAAGDGAAGNGEPDWLLRAREAQAIAQTGLAFTRDPYDRERFGALLDLAARMMAAGAATGTGTAGADAALAAELLEGFRREEGYATPKVDVRGAVFDARGRVLMVRELADGGRWTLPGGWADVNQTASECAVREVWEESGYRVEASKLAIVHDRGRQGHRPLTAQAIYKLFFLCRLLGDAPERREGNIETAEARFFAENELPLGELSEGRVLPHQLRQLFRHHAEPPLPTAFD